MSASPFSPPSPVADDAFDAPLALLANCDTHAASLTMTIPALASLTADLVVRKDDSVQFAGVQVNSARSALLAHKVRVLGSAKRLFRQRCKKLDAPFEAADVSKEQLRVWAVVSETEMAGPVFDYTFAASPLLALQTLVEALATGVNSVFERSLGGELGSVITGDGLRVVSAAGPGLKWFEPHSRNEFSVVLTQADGSVPAWLTTGDVELSVLPAIDNAPTWSAAPTGTVKTDAAAVGAHGTVSVVYGGLNDDDGLEVGLQLVVCGVAVLDAAADSEWGVRVCRRPLAGHECAAVGTHMQTLCAVDSRKFGLAVSADEKWMVVGLVMEGTLSVYSLPGGELVRTFGGKGSGQLQFKGLWRLCFAPSGDLMVVDGMNNRLQEVTLEGVFVRFVGVGEFGEVEPFCVAVHNDVIAVGCYQGTGPRVVLFDFGTGAVTSRFGEVGTAPGQLSPRCTSIRFAPDGHSLVVAELQAHRLSVFSYAGVFVRCVGVGLLGGGFPDVLFSASCEYVVAVGVYHRVCVFSPDGSELVRSWGVMGTGDGQFQSPTALAAAGQHLYVMDWMGGRVQVFE